MKRQHLIIGLGTLAVIAIVVFFMARPMGPSTDAEMPMDPAQAAMTNDGSFASPVDRSARWGFVLYDDVKMSAEAGVPGAAPSSDMTLNTADQVYIGETDEAHKNQVKVTLFDGKSGWVDTAKIFEATTFAPWNILDTSTAPLKDWIPEELVTPSTLPQYRIVISSEFLMRASKNSNPAIAEWAQAVLSGQAEGAAQ